MNEGEGAVKITLNSLLTTTAWLAGATLCGQNFDSTDFAGMQTAAKEEAGETESGPFKVVTEFDFVGASKIDEKGFRNQHLTFSTVDIGVGSVVYYDAPYKEGLYVSLDYDITKFKWTRNPYFDQTKFHTLTVGLAGFTSRACRWEWQAYIGANIDTDHFSFDYTTYDLLLWGRYVYWEGFGLNGGFVCETGMKADRVVPLFGVDWEINDQWELNAVFPVNMSVMYKIDCDWTAALVGRVFTSRHRVDKDETLPEGIWFYRNSGIEGAINYDHDFFHVNLHLGYTLGGRIKISDRHYNRSHRYQLQAAPYVGGEVSYRF